MAIVYAEYLSRYSEFHNLPNRKQVKVDLFRIPYCNYSRLTLPTESTIIDIVRSTFSLKLLLGFSVKTVID